MWLWLGCAAAICGAAFVALAAAAPPTTPLAVDLLALPAPPTRHPEHKRPLDIQRAGDRLVAVGEMGLVLWSDDSGHSWHQARVPTSVMLTAVGFADARRGWAVGQDGVVLRTEDAAQTWTVQLDGRRINAEQLAAVQRQADAESRLPATAHTAEQAEQTENRLADAEAAVDAGPSRPLLGVRFTSPQTGFIVGAYGQLLSTTDGGAHWAYIGDRLPNPTGLHLNGLTLAGDGTLFIAAEGGVVFASADQGRTWRAASTGYAGQLYGVLPVRGGVLAYGFHGHAFRSQDQGWTWQRVDLAMRHSLVDARLLSDGRVLLVAQSGELLLGSPDGLGFRAIQGGAADLSGALADTRQGRVVTVGAQGLNEVRWSDVAR